MTSTKQDIAAAAEAHTLSYISGLLPTTPATTTERATRAAAHYLPTIAFFAEGKITTLSDPSLLPTLIAATLDKRGMDKGPDIEAIEHRVEVVGESSAISWITFKKGEVVWTNLYFFRILESGESGWEGGIFDGENRMGRELEGQS